MTDPAPETPPVTAERLYLMTAFAALLAVLLLLAARGQSVGGLVLSAVGSAGALFRWRGAPGCLMLTVLGLWLVVPTVNGGPGASDVDVPLAFATLVYLMAQYRLYALADRGKPAAARTDAGPELGRGLAVLAVCLTAAAALWAVLPDGPRSLRNAADWAARAGPAGAALRERLPEYPSARADQPLWRLACLAWLFALGWAAAWGVLTALAARRASADEAAVLVQDVAWAESRRELERLARWADRGRRAGRDRGDA